MATEGNDSTHRAGLTHAIACDKQRKSQEYRNDETVSNAVVHASSMFRLRLVSVKRVVVMLQRIRTQNQHRCP